MHLVVIIETIGGYHAARLTATEKLLHEKGDRLTALQVVSSTREHPWGSIPFSFPAITSLHPQDDWEDILDQLQPDAIAIPGWGFWYSQRAIDWSRTARKPAIILSESKRDDAPRSWIKERYKQWRYVRHFASALVGSEEHRRYLLTLGMKSDSIFLGYDSVDNDYFAQTTSRLREAHAHAHTYPDPLPPRPFWLTVSRMIPRKNISLLIEAYAGYRQAIGEEWAWDLVLCGSGQEERPLKEKVRQMNLVPFIHFHGFKTYQEIPLYYAFAQALIHPALHEQWGLVLNEAAASGLPLIASNTVGAKELIKENVNGFLFDPRYSTSLLEVMLRYHRLSPEHRIQMSEQSRSIIERYHPDRFALGLHNAFEYARRHSKT